MQRRCYRRLFLICVADPTRRAALYLRLPGRARAGRNSTGRGFSGEDRLWPKGRRFSGISCCSVPFARKGTLGAAKCFENITLPAGISHFTRGVVFSEVWQSDLRQRKRPALHCVPVGACLPLRPSDLTISGLEVNICVERAYRNLFC